MLSLQVCVIQNGSLYEIISLMVFYSFFLAQSREEITVTMPDGSERKAKSWETSPMAVAKEVSKSLSERIVIAKVCHLFFFKKNPPCPFHLPFLKVDGELWDLERPLEKSCKLELLDFEHPEGRCKGLLVLESILFI